MPSVLERFGSKSTLASRPSEYKCTVRLLRESESIIIDFKKHDKGQLLIDYVCDYLELVEKDYFGLRFMDVHQHRYWLDPSKSIVKQIKVPVNADQIVFSFRVKFYPSSPTTVIKEELTRYYFFLQLKRDLLHGRLYCLQNDAAYLAACVIQDELGPYNADEHFGDYVSEFKVLPRQTAQMEDKVAAVHRTLGSKTPAEVELAFLQKASSMETYGFDPYEVKDANLGTLYVGANWRGILAYQGSRKVHHIQWDDVVKLDYVAKDFLIYCTASWSDHLDTSKRKLTFVCPSGTFSKHLWKHMLEQNVFFTSKWTSSVKPQKSSRHPQTLFRGSTFRYSGRVLNEIKERELPYRPEPVIKRVPSERQLSRTERRPPWLVNKCSTLPSRVVRSSLDISPYSYTTTSVPVTVNVGSADQSPSSSGYPSPNLIAGGDENGLVRPAMSYNSDVSGGPFAHRAAEEVNGAYASSDDSPSKLTPGEDPFLFLNELDTNGYSESDDRSSLTHSLDIAPAKWYPNGRVRGVVGPPGNIGDGRNGNKHSDRPVTLFNNPRIFVTDGTPSSGVLGKSDTPMGDDASVSGFASNEYPLLTKSAKPVAPHNASATLAQPQQPFFTRVVNSALTALLLCIMVSVLLAIVMELPSHDVRQIIDNIPMIGAFRDSFYEPVRESVTNMYDRFRG